MHLMIAIALGVFGGLWLFTRWGEWRVARWERQYERELRRLERQAERERAQQEERERLRAASLSAPLDPIARYGFRWPFGRPDNWLVTAYMLGLLALFPMLFLIFARG